MLWHSNTHVCESKPDDYSSTLCVCSCTCTAAEVDKTGFWGALTGILKRRRRERMSTAEDGIYLDEIDSDSMQPEELSQFFPSRYCAVLLLGLVKGEPLSLDLCIDE